MKTDRLKGRSILVVEDEYFIAKEIGVALRAQGAAVIGPASSLKQAVDLIKTTLRIDCAILDVNLGGEMVSPAADLLRDRGTPFLFTTGYDKTALPARFQNVARCEKPTDFKALVETLRGLIPEHGFGVQD